MSRDKYLDMMEQLGKEPIESEIPPDGNDLPLDMVHALNAFNMLGDRVYPEIGFIGKDYTNLPILIKLYGVDNTEFFLECLHILETKAIIYIDYGGSPADIEKLKREMDKLKRQSRGKSG